MYGGSVDSEVAGGGSGAVNGSSKTSLTLVTTAQLQHINETKVDANTGCPGIDIDSGSSGSQDGQERGQQAQASSGEGEKLSSKQAKKKTKKKMQKKRRQQAAAVKNDNRNVVTTAHEGVDAPKERVWDGVVYHCRTRQGTAKPPTRGGAAVTLVREICLSNNLPLVTPGLILIAIKISQLGESLSPSWAELTASETTSMMYIYSTHRSGVGFYRFRE